MQQLKEFCQKMIDFYQGRPEPFIRGKIEAYKEIIKEVNRLNDMSMQGLR